MSPMDQPERGRPDSADPAAFEPTTFSSFDRLIETCRRTRAVLVAVTHERADDGEAVRAIVAREALLHIDAVLDGLTLLARTASFTDPELRELVRRAGIVAPARAGSPDAIAAEREAANEVAREAMNGGPSAAGGIRSTLRAVDSRTMLAAGHARVVFSVIPALPPEAVAWPRAHRTYADIPVPRSESELLLRVEELARVLWRVAEGDDRRDEPLRRTLAFYEAGSRLSVRGLFAAA
jgi:hypothetical protein